MTKVTAHAARAATNPPALTLEWLLDEMVKEELIPQSAAANVTMPAPQRKDGAKQHPLVIAAAQDWPDRRAQGRKLSLEILTQWLAHRARLPYARIDPLKLDGATMTELVPYAYASRSGILPLSTGPKGIVFAVKDPFDIEWMRDLEPALKLPLKRVCANPLDIDRYLLEFYAIARSVKASGKERSRLAPAELRNLEQLTELSRVGKLSAEDQHVVAIVDWLLQYAFDSRASDIHLEPRRDTGTST
jgi:general secretion pathway protein E